MYFTGRSRPSVLPLAVWSCIVLSLGLRGVPRADRFRRLSFGDERAHAVEVFRCIDADAIESRFHRLDPDPVLERAQLFQRLRTFHRGGWQGGEAKKALAAVNVQADMPPRRRGRAAFAREGDWRAREIHGE